MPSTPLAKRKRPIVAPRRSKRRRVSRPADESHAKCLLQLLPDEMGVLILDKLPVEELPFIAVSHTVARWRRGLLVQNKMSGCIIDPVTAATTVSRRIYTRPWCVSAIREAIGHFAYEGRYVEFMNLLSELPDMQGGYSKEIIDAVSEACGLAAHRSNIKILKGVREKSELARYIDMRTYCSLPAAKFDQVAVLKYLYPRNTSIRRRVLPLAVEYSSKRVMRWAIEERNVAIDAEVMAVAFQKGSPETLTYLAERVWYQQNF